MCSYFKALKLGYINKTYTHTQSRTENSIFQFNLPDYYKTVFSVSVSSEVLSFSRTVNQLIMRVHKPKVEYKLALQEKPQGSILTYYYKTNNLTRIN